MLRGVQKLLDNEATRVGNHRKKVMERLLSISTLRLPYVRCMKKIRYLQLLMVVGIHSLLIVQLVTTEDTLHIEGIKKLI
jgi:hypothetical protein